jgi:hypothetical protein
VVVAPAIRVSDSASKAKPGHRAIQIQPPALKPGQHPWSIIRNPFERASENPVHSALVAMIFRMRQAFSRVRRIGCHPAVQRRPRQPASSAQTMPGGILRVFAISDAAGRRGFGPNLTEERLGPTQGHRCCRESRGGPARPPGSRNYARRRLRGCPNRRRSVDFQHQINGRPADLEGLRDLARTWAASVEYARDGRFTRPPARSPRQAEQSRDAILGLR